MLINCFMWTVLCQRTTTECWDSCVSRTFWSW